MATASKFDFELKEVAVALMKQQGVHDGKWQLSFNFNVSIGNLGLTEDQSRPGAAVQVMYLSLVKHDATKEGVPFVFDAAIENPARE